MVEKNTKTVVASTHLVSAVVECGRVLPDLYARKSGSDGLLLAFMTFSIGSNEPSSNLFSIQFSYSVFDDDIVLTRCSVAIFENGSICQIFCES
jgi:hypothetical protein